MTKDKREEGSKKTTGQKSEKKRRTALEELTRYLAPRMRTVAEAKKHLEEKLYEEPEVDSAIRRFLELGYLDDSEYVRAYCEYAFRKGRGENRIRQELRNKEIDSDVIDNGMEDYIYENRIDEYGMALEIAEKTLQGVSHPLEQRSLAKVARKLEQRGFASSTIIRILGEIKE